MEMLQGVWKQHLRPRAVVGYGVKIFLPSPPNYVTRSPGCKSYKLSLKTSGAINHKQALAQDVGVSVIFQSSTIESYPF